METLLTIGTIVLAIPASLMLMSLLNKKEDVKTFKSMAEMLKDTPEEAAQRAERIEANAKWCKSPARKAQMKAEELYKEMQRIEFLECAGNRRVQQIGEYR